MKREDSKVLALSALLVALMLILGWLENFIPAGPVPGIKLGLSNSVLLLAIFFLGIPKAFSLMIVKVLLSGLLFNPSAMPYAFAGGVLSMIAMSALSKLKLNTVVLGMVGAVMHNVGQVGMAMYILQTNGLMYYMGVLMLVGLFTGAATGTATHLLMNRLPASLRPNLNKKEGKR